MPKVDTGSLTKESNFFWLELISCEKNGFPVTGIDFLWPELLSFLQEYIHSLWQDIFVVYKIIYFLQNI